MTALNHILFCLGSLAAGGVIGGAFGLIQDRAARKNQRLQGDGKLSNGWAVMPGSMRRTAGFLIILALVQMICPLLFADGCQWWVSGGVAAGYGYWLYRGLQERIAGLR